MWAWTWFFKIRECKFHTYVLYVHTLCNSAAIHPAQDARTIFQKHNDSIRLKLTPDLRGDNNNDDCDDDHHEPIVSISHQYIYISH